MSPADRFLAALRATGPDAYRPGDRPGEWNAWCPGCRSQLVGARRLRVRETRGKLTFCCSTACTAESITSALILAERAYRHCPALTDWGLMAPSADGPHVEDELRAARQHRELVRVLDRERRAA